MPPGLDVTYVLPIRSSEPASAELGLYLRWLSHHVEVIAVDGSAPDVFAAQGEAWGPRVHHVPPAGAYQFQSGKVRGVHTGIDLARCDKVIVADDDVRWTLAQLASAAELLDDAELVRPQNAFSPLPWHARWDTGRTLLNRVFGGDHGGTVALRRDWFRRAGGYDGNTLFENLELERTIAAVGGRVVVALDLVVTRHPPSTPHFVGQRVRQAYDELARPRRLVAQLSMLPLLGLLVASRRWRALGAVPLIAVAVAETGRRRRGGRAAYPATAALWSVPWLAERAITSWLALGSRVLFGGVRWGDVRLRKAASSERRLREQLAHRVAAPGAPTPGGTGSHDDGLEPLPTT
ncbi:MAG: hypothetical protein AVDCRST_MAG50-2512 [uncultured Acidimicrobiales bacterium]|uniref:Glycosyltransferase 2-like domain-containing protein n=1 Tax=uncultured Acidimicrobiales bacterium TaxID=310071 RepID=A0A6J4IDV1_9ACTN|nr:MAG: hypothetical protein AVDCRST_MAG50-2512 [uncultured Acidimicrobiales bacterium]